MKIFSNFDTEFPEKQHDEACEKYGEECVYFIRRDKIFLILRVYLPVITFLIVSIAILTITYMYTSSNIARMAVWIFLLLWLLVLKYFWSRSIINFYLDFTIVTPNHITMYDQEGIFDRKIRSMDLSKVKSINVETKGLLCSIFNYGRIVFFSEGDDMGDIALDYITHPKKRRDEIAQVVNTYHRNSSSQDE